MRGGAAVFFVFALLSACSRTAPSSDRGTTVKSSNPTPTAAANGPNAADAKAASAANDVFALVEHLSSLARLDAGAVKRVTGVNLARQSESTQPYFWIDVGRADAGLVRRVELRSSKTDPEKALLIVDVAASPCHEIGAFRERFGAESNFSPPSPHAPADAPFYVEFAKARDAGKLTFGFSRAEPACLVTIIFDRIARVGGSDR